MEELFRVYQLLADNPRYGISRSDFLCALGIRGGDGVLSASAEQEFERAKKALRDAGVPLVSTDRGGYRLGHTVNPLTGWELDIADYRMLNMLCQGWYGTELESSARRILRKVALCVPSLHGVGGLGEYAEPITRVRFPSEPYLEDIFEALSERKNISITYQNYSGHTRGGTVSLWGVGYRYGHWYFACTDTAKELPAGRAKLGFTYRLSRMGSLTTHKTAPRAFRGAPAGFGMVKALESLQEWPNSTLEVEDALTGQRFTVPSYGTVETAIEAISSRWVIPRTDEENAHQHQVRSRQRRILQRLHSGHATDPTIPESWKKNTSRTRPDTVDKFIDVLLALHYVGATGRGSLKQVGAALGVDTGKAKKLFDSLCAIERYYDRQGAGEQVPFERGFDDYSQWVQHLPLGPGHRLYSGLSFSGIELVVLLFSLEAAGHIFGADARLERLRALVGADARATSLDRTVGFYPDQDLGDIREAIANSRALRFRYGDQDYDRVVDPYGLVFMNNQFYLYAFCRVSAASGGSAWRNFRLTSMGRVSDAGPARMRTPPRGAHTPEEWSRAQQVNERNPFALLRVRTEMVGSPGSSAVKDLCRRLGKMSSHTVALDTSKPNSPKTYHRVHYFPGRDGEGTEHILDLVISYGGDVELLGPPELREALRERVNMLLGAEREITH